MTASAKLCYPFRSSISRIRLQCHPVTTVTHYDLKLQQIFLTPVLLITPKENL